MSHAAVASGTAEEDGAHAAVTKPRGAEAAAESGEGGAHAVVAKPMHVEAAIRWAAALSRSRCRRVMPPSP